MRESWFQFPWMQTLPFLLVFLSACVVLPLNCSCHHGAAGRLEFALPRSPTSATIMERRGSTMTPASARQANQRRTPEDEEPKTKQQSATTLQEQKLRARLVRRQRVQWIHPAAQFCPACQEADQRRATRTIARSPADPVLMLRPSNALLDPGLCAFVWDDADPRVGSLD